MKNKNIQNIQPSRIYQHFKNTTMFWVTFRVWMWWMASTLKFMKIHWKLIDWKKLSKSNPYSFQLNQLNTTWVEVRHNRPQQTNRSFQPGPGQPDVSFRSFTRFLLGGLELMTYCQAQLKLQLQFWLKLSIALFSFFSDPPPTTHPPTRNSSLTYSFNSQLPLQLKP